MLKIEVLDREIQKIVASGNLDVVTAELVQVISYIDKSIDDKGARKFFRNSLLKCLTEVVFADKDEEESEERECDLQMKNFNALFKAIMDLSEIDPKFKEKADDALKQWNALHPDKNVESFKQLYEESSEFMKKGMN